MRSGPEELQKKKKRKEERREMKILKIEN